MGSFVVMVWVQKETTQEIIIRVALKVVLEFYFRFLMFSDLKYVQNLNYEVSL